MNHELKNRSENSSSQNGAFPEDFLFGVATAAHQVEGGLYNNDWSMFTASPAIRSRLQRLSSLAGQLIHLRSAGEALRYEDLDTLEADLDRAQALGLNAYRFSLEWSRLQPRPPGRWSRLDSQAVDYYCAVIDACRKRGLEPLVTLNHFSLPLWVLTPPESSALLRTIGLPRAAPDAGFRASLQGWENPATVDAFVAYTRRVVRRFKNDVKVWITLNEPVGAVIGLGYVAGAWPPGFNLDGPRARRAYFNLIRAHVRAYEAIKRIDAQTQVGIAHAMMYTKTASKAPPVVLSSHEAGREQFDYFYNWHFLEAVINGRLDTNLQNLESGRSYLQEAELNEFLGLEPDAGPARWPRLDFVGLNYYRAVYVYRHPVGTPMVSFTGGFIHNDLRDHPEPHQLTNDLGWEIYPQGLGSLLEELDRRYHLPILITENGLAEAEDRNRAAHLSAHLEQVLRAMKKGAEVRGYLYWTLADNFEWHEAYSDQSRFGLFQVERAQPGLPRRITTGALALSMWTAARSVEPVIQRYGAVLPDGSRVQPPVLSAGGTWEGKLEDGTPLVLHLDRLQDHVWWGILFYPQDGQWFQLRKIGWEPAESRLTFEHAGRGKLAERKFEASLAGTDFQGSLLDGGRRLNWQVFHLPLSGNWQSADWPYWLSFDCLEGSERGWLGRWLTGERLDSWELLDVFQVEGEGIEFRIAERLFRVKLNGETLEGQIESQGFQRHWRAHRLPDELPF